MRFAVLAVCCACLGPLFVGCSLPANSAAEDWQPGVSADAGADDQAGEQHTPADPDDAPGASAEDPSAEDPGAEDTNSEGTGAAAPSGQAPEEDASDDAANTGSGEATDTEDTSAPSTPGHPEDGASEPSLPERPAPEVNGSVVCTGDAALPASFARNCAGCHSLAGAATGSAPDLRSFSADLSAFSERVRAGGNGMPSFGDTALAAADLEAIFSYFTSAAEATTGASCEVLVADACSGVAQPVTPLYGMNASATAAVSEPLLTQNSDGSLQLRAGGRVRGRHEREGDFSPYHAQYFENRSYTFIVEDNLPAGGNTLKITWLPIAPASDDQVINLRYWYTGDGNVFHTNVGMERLGSLHWEYTVDYNVREGREIQLGDRLDFEFGVFYDENQVEGRTSYYSDNFRYIVGSGELTPFDSPQLAALAGGDTTIPFIYEEPALYFEQMALNIQGENAQQFLEGRRLFHTDFTQGEHSEGGNPVFTEQAGKAGPLSNQTSCSACHENNGRGVPPAAGELAETLVFKTFDVASTAMAAAEHPVYGRQLQTTGAGAAEGQVQAAYTEELFQFPDGEEVMLRRPEYQFDGEAVILSPRLPRPVFGLGLLEAVSEASLLAFADAEDCNGDGLSGRPNLVPDPASGVLRIGRFGWKAGKVDLQHQVADALQLDLGVTTSLLSGADCGELGNCSDAAAELSDDDLAKFTTYARLLGVPPRRDLDNASVQRGEDAFLQTGCAQCHLPTLQTSNTHPLLELREQVIHAYTDLLLHDLGPDLADPGAGEYTAAAAEWRTPPLWGLGLAATVNGEVHLLHDGRARSTVEAILWHGGEASAAKSAFAELPAATRADLLAFLDSL